MLMNDKKGEMGIGTLIIFIAMILVAAIAAGVLVTTATSLQNKALLTGTRSKAEVSTYLNVLSVYGENGSDNNLEELYVDVKLAAGSDKINLNGTLLTNYLETSSASYEYGGNVTSCVSGSITSSDEFYVEYLLGGDNPGYLLTGDVVRLCFDSAASITEDTEFGIKLISEVGTPTTVETVAPSIMTTEKVFMYP